MIRRGRFCQLKIIAKYSFHTDSELSQTHSSQYSLFIRHIFDRVVQYMRPNIHNDLHLDCFMMDKTKISTEIIHLKAYHKNVRYLYFKTYIKMSEFF